MEIYLARLGLRLVVDESEGMAYLRQLSVDEAADGYDGLPKLFKTTRNGVTDLRYVSWLSNSDLRYWGDIDVEGFQILSRLRIAFQSTRSLLMDAERLTSWHPQIGTTGMGSQASTSSNLTEEERCAYLMCVERNLRIEQERFPQWFISEYVESLFHAP